LVIHQDQEDQEEINNLIILKYKSQIPDIIGIWDFFIKRIFFLIDRFCNSKQCNLNLLTPFS
ncbi:MAG: hypothetical protein ABIP27_08155, partial [Flavobacterium circumlabens]|uniref:hypothetical protein n=1 Tax=Flavobacterium circumlabens TaxID=2133765 RepID=UPI0032645007